MSPLRIRVYHGTDCSGTSLPIDAVEYRAETVRKATSNELDVCVCTSAFGMGHFQYRHVVHLVPPRSLSEYAQNIGRAGRDGSQAIAVMMFHP